MLRSIKFITFLLVGFLLFQTVSTNVSAQESTYEGKIVRILEENGNYQKMEVELTSGELKGSRVIVENGVYTDIKSLKYKLNDPVIVAASEIEDGEKLYVIADHIRRPILLYLFLTFCLIVAIVAGKWGLLSILGMAYSFYVIFVFVLPMILKGYDAVLISIIGSAFIIPVTFSFSHGLNRKTVNAMIGTIISMVIVGLLSIVLVNLSKLTGFAAEEASFLQYQLGDLINLRGILLAGIIISSLGVMDDITVSQSSVVEELKKANQKLSRSQLFVRSMRVGKDHISSMVNTLILVYTGASLPLLLLFVNSPHPFMEVINYEIVAEEIVRTLVGSIGLVLAVPITTFVAAASVGNKKLK